MVTTDSLLQKTRSALEFGTQVALIMACLDTRTRFYGLAVLACYGGFCAGRKFEAWRDEIQARVTVYQIAQDKPDSWESESPVLELKERYAQSWNKSQFLSGIKMFKSSVTALSRVLPEAGALDLSGLIKGETEQLGKWWLMFASEIRRTGLILFALTGSVLLWQVARRI